MAMALAVALVACQGAVGKTGEKGPEGPPGPSGDPPEPENQAPIALATGPIQGPALVEEGEDKTMVVSGYFRDVDGDVLSYPAPTVDLEGIVSVALAANEAGEQVLTISPLARGDATITVTATDPGGLSASVMINVTVDPEGMARPEYVGDLPSSLALMPGEERTIDVAGAFVEHENEDLTITYEKSDEDPAVVRVTQDGNRITITALATTGDATVTIVATDTDGLSVKHPIMVSVRATLMPERSDMNPESVTLEVGGAPDVIEDVSVYFDNHGLADLMYEPDSSDDDVAVVAMNDIRLTITPMGAGMAIVTVTASNEHGSVDLMIDVEVNGTPPSANEDGIPDQELMIGESKEILLDQYFTPGAGSTHDDLTYRATSGDPTKVTPAVARGSEVLIITGEKSGRATVTVTAMDNDGETAMQEIDVDVTEEVAEAPLPTPTNILKARDITASVMINLDDYFSDATRYTAMPDDERILRTSVVDNMLTLTPVSHGRATVTVTPSNSSGNGIAQTFSVTVKARPALKENMMLSSRRATAVTQAQADEADTLDSDKGRRLLSAIIRYDLSTYITDPDGDDTKLKFSTKTNKPEIVTVYNTPDDAGATDAAIEAEGAIGATGLTMESTVAKVTLRGQKVGTANIKVMATDEDGLEYEWEFMVTVVASNGQPTVEGTPEAEDFDGTPLATRLDVGNVKNLIDGQLITTLFDDPDFLSGDELKFELKVYGADATAVNLLEGMRLREAKDADGSDDALYQKPLTEDKAQVSGVVSPKTWNGNRASTIKVTLTALRGSSAAAPAADVVAIIATDKFGLQNVRVFSVRVNSTMKAEGAQASATPTPGTPRKLSGRGEKDSVEATSEGAGTTTNSDGVLEMSWNNTGNNIRTIALVANNAGHFHDPDDDPIMCSYVRSPAESQGDTPDPVATVALDGSNNTLTITPTEATDKLLTVTVTCKETLAGAGDVTARFGPSVSDTLTVRVTGKTFSQR